MRIIGAIVVASAALLTGDLAAAAAPGAGDAGTPIITPRAFAEGIDMQSGRSATVDWADGIGNKYRFSPGFAAPCDSARIQSLFCRDEN